MARVKFLPDAIAFVAALACSVIFGWDLGGIVWGILLSSLVVTTGVVFVALAKKGSVATLIVVPGGLAGWHLVLALFAASLYPLHSDRDEPFSLFLSIWAALKLYWPFLPMAVVSRWREFRNAEINFQRVGLDPAWYIRGRSASVLADLARVQALILLLLFVADAGLPPPLRAALPYVAVLLFFLPLDLFGLENPGGESAGGAKEPQLTREIVRALRQRAVVRARRQARHAEGAARGSAFMVEYIEMYFPGADDGGIVFHWCADAAETDVLVRRLAGEAKVNRMLGVYDLARPLDGQGDGLDRQQWVDTRRVGARCSG